MSQHIVLDVPEGQRADVWLELVTGALLARADEYHPGAKEMARGVARSARLVDLEAMRKPVKHGPGCTETYCACYGDVAGYNACLEDLAKGGK